MSEERAKAARREARERRALVAAMAADRAWFAAHPHARAYLRPVIIGEFTFDELSLFTARGAFVRVTQIEPGLRTRELVTPPHNNDETDGHVLCLDAWSGEILDEDTFAAEFDIAPRA